MAKAFPQPLDDACVGWYVRLLVSADVVGVLKSEGLRFSSKSEPLLCDPVNVVATTDHTVYVALPDSKTVGISREKITVSTQPRWW